MNTQDAAAAMSKSTLDTAVEDWINQQLGEYERIKSAQIQAGMAAAAVNGLLSQLAIYPSDSDSRIIPVLEKALQALKAVAPVEF